MPTSKYSVEIVWSERHQGYIATTVELPGCTAWGATQEEALRAVRQEMETWMETARSNGWEIPQPSPKAENALTPHRPHCPPGFVPYKDAIKTVLHGHAPSILSDRDPSYVKLLKKTQQARQDPADEIQNSANKTDELRGYAPWQVRTTQVEHRVITVQGEQVEIVECVHLEDYRRWARETLHYDSEYRRARFHESVKNNPAAAISEFLKAFEEEEDPNSNRRRLRHASIPVWVLEYMAERFEQWKKSGTLDEAFNVKGTGRGKKTPKDRLFGGIQSRIAYCLYGIKLKKLKNKEKQDDAAVTAQNTNNRCQPKKTMLCRFTETCPLTEDCSRKDCPMVNDCPLLRDCSHSKCPVSKTNPHEVIKRCVANLLCTSIDSVNKYISFHKKEEIEVTLKKLYELYLNEEQLKDRANGVVDQGLPHKRAKQRVAEIMELQPAEVEHILNNHQHSRAQKQ